MSEVLRTSTWTQIPESTLADWREDAIKRGGVPQPGDADPHARYLANRITRLIDALEAALAPSRPTVADERGEGS